MGRAPSEATQLRTARREIAELRKKLSTETQSAAFYRARASKAETEANEWKRRFDQLLAREPVPAVPLAPWPAVGTGQITTDCGCPPGTVCMNTACPRRPVVTCLSTGKSEPRT